jgi:hypothetical protein
MHPIECFADRLSAIKLVVYRKCNVQVTFDSVDWAWQIFDLPSVSSIAAVTPAASSSAYPFESHAQHSSLVPPHVGCLLIYSKQLDGVTGHVAAIVEVGSVGDANASFVRLGEQNWSNAQWDGATYSRQLALTQDATTGAFSIGDDFVLGWKCVKQ